MTDQHNTKYVKLLFEVVHDDGAVDIESVWAVPVADGYKLDNIPFYAKEVAWNDVVSAALDERGALRYTGLNVASGHSTIRMAFDDESKVASVREHLEVMGCSSELFFSRFVAVDVPPSVPYQHVRAYLDEQYAAGIFDYEEACLGQAEKPDRG